MLLKENLLLGPLKRAQIRILSAFTLAEVLVTLAIVGIIASITIPALLNNIQEKELKTAWKKHIQSWLELVWI